MEQFSQFSHRNIFFFGHFPVFPNEFVLPCFFFSNKFHLENAFTNHEVEEIQENKCCLFDSGKPMIQSEKSFHNVTEKRARKKFMVSSSEPA